MSSRRSRRRRRVGPPLRPSDHSQRPGIDPGIPSTGSRCPFGQRAFLALYRSTINVLRLWLVQVNHLSKQRIWPSPRWWSGILRLNVDQTPGDSRPVENLCRSRSTTVLVPLVPWLQCGRRPHLPSTRICRPARGSRGTTDRQRRPIRLRLFLKRA